jgi:Type II secretory pathway, ATPase PulE/Tfp pilus assembly pathway, ATPase PilB
MQQSDADTRPVASVSTSADEFVLQLALTRGELREEQLTAARAVVAAHSDPAQPPPTLVDVLRQNGAIDERTMTRFLAEAFHMEFAELRELRVPGPVLALVPPAFARRHRLIPLAHDGKQLRVALADPLDADGIDLLAHLTGLQITPVAAPPHDVAEALDRFYGPEQTSFTDDPAHVPTTASISPPSAPPPAPSTPLETDSDAPIIKLVHSIIAEAVRRRASDIHLEPLPRRFRVRYRIDGVLVEADNPPKRLQLATISRVKIMANISIAEKRVPQDGRIQITIDGRSLDLRVSSLPTAHGESIVMRILDKEGLQLGLPELGFAPDDQATFERLISLPDGIVLVTGPTGSGKTTTLYSCLHHLNKTDRKIITVEDPVEYQLTGINQVPVRPEIGMTFASALRAMLRQAPNVVMVGEIRDRETAEIAINASLTGHMVFSTLHTNDAPGAVTRLLDIGVKPFLVATSLRATMAQRLVRKICENCRAPHPPTTRELALTHLTPAQIAAAHFARGTGCASCHGSGYRGRTGIFEIFQIDDDIQRMIHAGASAAQLRSHARSRGMRTMREDGLRKASAGLTTIDEVVSITLGDPS